MSQLLETRRRLALQRFASFFGELKGAFCERDDVLDQVALALLGRQHVLMTGPPGTAKSGLSAGLGEGDAVVAVCVSGLLGSSLGSLQLMTGGVMPDNVRDAIVHVLNNEWLRAVMRLVGCAPRA